MRRSTYLKQLQIDLQKWAAAGLIDGARIPALLGDAGPPEQRRSLSHILAFLGAIMLACAALAFVGANWQHMPRLAKLGLLLLTMWAIYGASLVALGRDQPLFAQAALLLGVAMFGANVMLIGQIYHINAGWPSGVLVWGLGALVAAIVVPSRASAAFAAGLLTLWSVSSVTESHWIFHWPFLPVLAILLAFGIWQRWAPILHLALIAFGIWCITNAASLTDHFDIDGAVAMFALTGIAIALWLIGRIFALRQIPFGNVISGYGLFAATAATFALQWADNPPLSHQTVLIAAAAVALPVLLLAIFARATHTRPHGLRSADIALVTGILICGLGILLTGYPPHDKSPYFLALLYLGYIVWLLNYGLSRQRSFPVNLALVAFAAEVLVLYFMTFDTLLNRSALFALGGILFILAALVLDRARRRLLRSAT